MQVGLKGCKYLHPQGSFGWSVNVYTSEVPVLFQIWAQGATTNDVYTSEVPVLFRIWAQGTSDNVHTNEVHILFQIWVPQGTSEECKKFAHARSVILSPYVPTLLTILLMQTTGQKLAMLTVMFWRLCIHQRPVLNKQDPNGVKIWFCGLTWEKVYWWEEFWNASLLVTEFDRPGVTLCGWHDIKIQLLTTVKFVFIIWSNQSVAWCFYTVVCF